MITSTANAKIKRIIQMQKKRKARDEEGLFQVEGIRMFREIPPRDLQEIYVSQSFWEKEESLVREMADRACIRPELVSDSVFEHLSATRTPQGILCLVRQKHYRPEDLTGEGTPFVMVLDRLQDPGNVGTGLSCGPRKGQGLPVLCWTRNARTFTIPRPSALPWVLFSACHFVMRKIWKKGSGS